MHDTADDKRASEGQCPVVGHRHTAAGATANLQWWPNQLNLKVLHQNSPLSDPHGRPRSTTRKSSRRSTSPP